MKTMKKIIAALAAVAMLAGAFTGCGEKKKTELVKFNVGYLASTGHILYFIAQEKGYFKENGLDVELFLFNNSGEGINAIIAGKLDAGSFGTAPPFTFIEKGAGISIFGGQMIEGHALVAKPEVAEQIKDITSLKGKTIATVRLATGDIAFRSAMSKAGLDWKNEVTINEMESPAAALEAVKKGSADAGVVWTPFRKMAEDQGLKIIFYTGQFEGLAGHPCCRQIAVTEKLKEREQDYKNFLAALIQAYDFYKTNKDESIDILSKYVKVDKGILVAETYGPHVGSNPDPNKKEVIEFWNAMIAAGYLTDKSIDIASYINTALFESALDAVLKKNPDNANYKQLKADFKK
ncbi:MAG: ABC transporter substrate-binding protein [Candidatus Fibromonas sp.]|jgi:NitT/TauT family transport system substrate-binding protein|nr:ABC transporter substrate-binding protein [Candidatus Fibromonas sp.]